MIPFCFIVFTLRRERPLEFVVKQIVKELLPYTKLVIPDIPPAMHGCSRASHLRVAPSPAVDIMSTVSCSDLLINLAKSCPIPMTVYHGYCTEVFASAASVRATSRESLPVQEQCLPTRSSLGRSQPAQHTSLKMRRFLTPCLLPSFSAVLIPSSLASYVGRQQAAAHAPHRQPQS
eukprot:SAG22_NODE_1851_length_3443_cov_4.745215_1_plen_176_part_00